MSDSSSEDEHLKNLQQAVDKNFINDFMFNKKSNKRDCTVKNKLPPSLRNITDDQDRHNELHVTPEFQKHVAKHLSKLLDKQFKEVQPKTTNTSSKRHRNNRGIRLLQNSASFVLCEDEAIKLSVNNKRKVEESGDSEEEMEKVAMAAVTPEWVLNKTETKAWAERTKGEVLQGVLLGKTKKKKKKKKVELQL